MKFDSSTNGNLSKFLNTSISNTIISNFPISWTQIIFPCMRFFIVLLSATSKPGNRKQF